MKFPSDLDKDFVGTWEAFISLRAVQDVAKINEKAVEDAFRLLLKQAGTKTVIRFAARQFLTVKDSTAHMKRRLDLSYVMNHMTVFKHRFEFDLPLAEQINVIHKPKVIGVVELKPRAAFRFEYLMERLLQLKVFRHEIPRQLRSDKGKFPVAPKHESDWYTLYRDETLVFQLSANRKGHLLLRYELVLGEIVPAYKDLKKQLRQLWENAVTGVIR